jgi:hypothetical protein
MPAMTTTAAPASRSPEMRLLVGAQLAIPAAALLGFALVYLGGLATTGDHATLIGPPPVDPKEGIPFGFHAWNPFTWLYLAVVLMVSIGWVFVALAGLLGAANLARPAVRADRRSWRPLLAGTLACAAYLALLFSPATRELLVWFAD